MVFVNGTKFACESCIKGHRSSSCHHSERPLFEIKKKGRPVSQCEKCRGLRQSNRLHSKCVCGSEKEERKAGMKQLSANSKRYIPIRPTLPNGLKDALDTNKSTIPPDPRAQVEALLNPCNCKDVWSCKCRSRGVSEERSDHNGGLEALAQAAAMCCAPIDPAPSVLTPLQKQNEIRSGSCCQPPGLHSPPSKRRCQSQRKSPSPADKERRGPTLLPILSIPPSSAISPTVPPPNFPVIPPLSAIVSLANTGCTCGFDCTCPGCTEHRGKENAANDHGDCSNDCGTCVDHQHGIELPTSTPFGTMPVSTASMSFIDAFFACAAAIPPPPAHRAPSIALDGSNVTVYPRSLFDGEGKTSDKVSRAFGLVQLPKLECCAGRCGCPGDTCGCGNNCDGSCSNHDGGVSVDSSGAVRVTDPSDSSASGAAKSSCCSG